MIILNKTISLGVAMNQIKYPHDYELVHKYLCGDKSAGQQLYGEAIPLLEKFVFSCIKKSSIDISDADDIVIETLKRSIERLDRYNGNSKFSVFLNGIAKNVIKETLRKKGKEISLEEIPDSNYESIITLYSQNPLIVLLQKERYEAIKNAIDNLSPEHKEIIYLRLFNKVPVKTIAELSNESVAAIDSRFRRALKALRKNLKKF